MNEARKHFIHDTCTLVEPVQKLKNMGQVFRYPELDYSGMLIYHCMPTPIPRCEVHTTIPAAMLDVFRVVGEIRDTTQTNG